MGFGGTNVSTVWIVLIVIIAILAVATVAMYLIGRKAQKKRDEQQGEIDAHSQTVSMLIIDKKKLRVKDSGLPEVVINQTPWYAKLSKLPIVKAKVGPKIMTLIADVSIYDDIPVKREVKATVSGIYITGVKGLRTVAAPEEKKKGFFGRKKAASK